LNIERIKFTRYGYKRFVKGTAFNLDGLVLLSVKGFHMVEPV